MRDEETATWWQQVTGEALYGPLKGRHLKYVPHDELTFEKWKAEQPSGTVLRPDQQFASSYASANWEERMQKTPVVTPASPNDPFSSRALIVGIDMNDTAKAYSFADLEKVGPIQDTVNGTPIVVVLGEDKKSVRAFERMVDGRTLDLFQKPDSPKLILVDPETASEFDFTGKGISGPLTGKQLRKIDLLLDYWFDWKNYHPKVDVYSGGEKSK